MENAQTAPATGEIVRTGETVLVECDEGYFENTTDSDTFIMTCSDNQVCIINCILGEGVGKGEWSRLKHLQLANTQYRE
jgi:hypothetical protein